MKKQDINVLMRIFLKTIVGDNQAEAILRSVFLQMISFHPGLNGGAQMNSFCAGNNGEGCAGAVYTRRLIALQEPHLREEC